MGSTKLEAQRPGGRRPDATLGCPCAAEDQEARAAVMGQRPGETGMRYPIIGLDDDHDLAVAAPRGPGPGRAEAGQPLGRRGQSGPREVTCPRNLVQAEC